MCCLGIVAEGWGGEPDRTLASPAEGSRSEGRVRATEKGDRVRRSENKYFKARGQILGIDLWRGRRQKENNGGMVRREPQRAVAAAATRAAGFDLCSKKFIAWSRFIRDRVSVGGKGRLTLHGIKSRQDICEANFTII